LYVGTFKPELVALDSKTGKQRWNVPAQGWIWSPPLLKDGVLYYGSLAGEVFAVNATSGETIWRIQPAIGDKAAIAGTPAMMGQTLYFSTQGGILYAVDAATGVQTWNKQLEGQLQASLQVVGDTLLVAPTATATILVALDASGNQKWAFIPAK